MKHLLFMLLFTALSGSGVLAQNYDREIRKDFSAYLGHIRDKDFDKAMDYTYERFFELIPRDKLTSMMNATFNDPEIENDIVSADILQVGEPHSIEGEYFSIVTYESVMRMKFKFGEAGETQEEFEQRMTMTRLSLEEIFGPENVYYEAETGFYRLTAMKKVCAISDDKGKDWKFVVLEREQKDYLKRILPEAIIGRAY